MATGDYSIGSGHWPGVSKLIEKAGEVQQVVGKLIAINGNAEHWDGSDLHARLTEELADLTAAIQFVVSANGLDAEFVALRADSKLQLFREWHAQERRAALKGGG